MAVAMAHLALPNDDMEISSDVEGGNFIDIEVDDEIGEDEDYMVDDNAVIVDGSGSGFQVHKLKDDDIMVDDGGAQDDLITGATIDNDVVLLDEEEQEDGDISDNDLDPSDIQQVTTPKPDYAAQVAFLKPQPDTFVNHDNDLSTLPSAASTPDPSAGHPESPEHPSDAHFLHSNTADHEHIFQRIPDDDIASKENDSDTENIVPGANSYSVDEHSIDAGRTSANHPAVQSEHNIGLGIQADNHQLGESSDSDPLLDRVHPVLVTYDEEEIFLFRTQDSEDTRSFFFDDEALVFESVKDLLHKCRELLADNLDEHTILELRIPVLELIIAEDSQEAGVLTLHDILTLYLHFNDNDDDTSPPPLAVGLFHKVRLATRWVQLREWAKEGYSWSQLVSSYEIVGSSNPNETAKAEAGHVLTANKDVKPVSSSTGAKSLAIAEANNETEEQSLSRIPANDEGDLRILQAHEILGEQEQMQERGDEVPALTHVSALTDDGVNDDETKDPPTTHAVDHAEESIPQDITTRQSTGEAVTAVPMDHSKTLAQELSVEAVHSGLEGDTQLQPEEVDGASSVAAEPDIVDDSLPTEEDDLDNHEGLEQADESVFITYADGDERVAQDADDVGVVDGSTDTVDVGEDVDEAELYAGDHQKVNGGGNEINAAEIVNDAEEYVDDDEAINGDDEGAGVADFANDTENQTGDADYIDDIQDESGFETFEAPLLSEVITLRNQLDIDSSHEIDNLDDLEDYDTIADNTEDVGNDYEVVDNGLVPMTDILSTKVVGVNTRKRSYDEAETTKLNAKPAPKKARPERSA